MRIKPGTGTHYVLVAAQGRSLPSEFFDTMPNPLRPLYRSQRRAIDDMLAAGLIVHAAAGAYGPQPGYLPTDEGHRAIQNIVDTGYYDTAQQ
jgi:hypothetical protein